VDDDVGYEMERKIKKFEAVKTDVPLEIAEALNLTDINIQTQHDSYFLLNDSPGEVARKLNELTGLDVIDRLFKYINGKTTEAKRGVDDESIRIKTLDIDIEKLSYIDQLEIDLNDLDLFIRKKDEKQTKRNSVSNILQTISGVNAKIRNVEDALSYEKEIYLLSQAAEGRRGKESSLGEVQMLLSNLDSLSCRIGEEIEWLNVEPEHSTISDMSITLAQNKAFFNDVKSLLSRIGGIYTESEKMSNSLNAGKERYEKTLKEHGLCPLCGSKINSTILKGILS
jgi:hypothetical protein